MCNKLECSIPEHFLGEQGVLINNSIKIFSFYPYSHTNWNKTTISANANCTGRTILALISASWDSGDFTSSHIWMLRCGYDGNHVTKTVIAEDNVSSVYHLDVGVSDDGYIQFKPTYDGIFYVTLITNR